MEGPLSILWSAGMRECGVGAGATMRVRQVKVNQHQVMKGVCEFTFGCLVSSSLPNFAMLCLHREEHQSACGAGVNPLPERNK